MAPLLAIKDLAVGFPQNGKLTKAVRQISFDVEPGELVAVVGESGSGKSVTALSILQLLPPHTQITGEVLFNKQGEQPVNLLALSGSALASTRGNDIAMIFQEPMTSLNPLITCGRQVMEVLQQHRQMSTKAASMETISLFTRVELPDPARIVNRYPHELSGGQKQRVMIAMAMCCNPAILIADEPTTALDVTVQQTILQLIKSLQQQNSMGVIFITHDLAVVADIADKIVVMYRGEIVEQGDSGQILHSPVHPYTKALLACRPATQKKGSRLPVVSDFLSPEKAGHDHQPEGPITSPLRPATAVPLEVKPVLEIKNLRVQFPAIKNFFGKAIQYVNAVDDVSFTVNQGEIVGLVGESGCGKTSLGRSILQLIKPSSGKIVLNGQDLAEANAGELRRLRRDLQIVFQDPYGSLNPRISIGEAIAEPLLVHTGLTRNQRKDKVTDLLQKVNLDSSLFSRYPHQFSGGQRQRICIARALALNPSFLVFDESVSALDVSVQAQVLNLLNDLKREFGFTAIFISHDLSLVHYLCNRILVMQKGKIVEDGDADSVYHNPVNAYTKQLISAIPGKQLFQSS